jgi:lysophospholipase L1-like esterase
VSHVVLLGDSTFDNAVYVGGGPDVIVQLRDALPSGWSATLGAVDGAVADDVARQLTAIPPNSTHLVVSVGGNDALAHIDLLSRPARSAADVFGWLADAASAFEVRYRRMLGTVLSRRLPTAICTIYNGNLPDPTMQRLASTALTAFNDTILRAAIESGTPVIDLRLFCNEPSDYANPIEPSVRGGAKIARAVVRALTERCTAHRRCEIFGG